MRIRITFAKTDAMRFTGHLDLHHTWERTIRRAGLPLAYTQGYSPHPRINLASALPLGFTSDCEIVDIWLEAEMPTADIKAALEHAAPPGMRILDTRQVDDRAPTLQTIVEASDYTITFLNPVPSLGEKCQALLAADALPRRWREKAYDLRPLILNLHPLSDDEDRRQRISVQLTTREGATGRPEEVIAVLGEMLEDTCVHRERLIFKEMIPSQETA